MDSSTAKNLIGQLYFLKALSEGIKLKGPNYLLQQVPLHHLDCKVRVLLQASSNLREVLLMVQNKTTLPFLQIQNCGLAKYNPPLP